MTSHQHDPDGHHESRSRVALQAVRSHVRPGSFPLLLAAALLLYVLNGLAITARAGAAFGHLTVMLAGLYVLSTNRTTLWLSSLVVALTITLEAHLWTPEPFVRRALLDAAAIGLYLWILLVVLREVFRPTTTERNAVVGALCGFMLILMTFMRVHGLIEAVEPGSFGTNGPPFSERSDAMVLASFQYLSTIVLTTVGFGDIVPITPAARLVTGLEAIVGQMYLAVVIAMLVGRVAAPRRG